MLTHERLKAWRLGRGLSQRAAAALADMSQAAWQSYEAGTSTPKVNAAALIESATKGKIRVNDWRSSPKSKAA